MNPLQYLTGLRDKLREYMHPLTSPTVSGETIPGNFQASYINPAKLKAPYPVISGNLGPSAPTPKPPVVSAPTPKPTPKPTAKPTATPAKPNQSLMFDYTQYPNTTGFAPQQPPASIAQLIWSLFPNEATKAAIVAASENGTFNPKVKDNVNSDGSIDRGLWQINDRTFNGLMARKPKQMQQLGINDYSQMLDAYLNSQVAKLIKDEGGWGRWFGWQNTGYDLLNGYFTSPYKKGR